MIEELMRLADDGSPLAHDDDHRDCLNCGMCESCIERSIATAEEMDPTFVPAWDGDYEDA